MGLREPSFYDPLDDHIRPFSFAGAPRCEVPGTGEPPTYTVALRRSDWRRKRVVRQATNGFLSLIHSARLKNPRTHRRRTVQRCFPLGGADSSASGPHILRPWAAGPAQCAITCFLLPLV